MSSEFLKHTQCPDCGGSDCLALYSNGTGYCWGSCDGDGKGFKSEAKLQGREDEESFEAVEQFKNLIDDITYNALAKRKISKDICQKYKYGIGIYKNATVQVASYCDDKGRVIAQKTRDSNKKFAFIGESSQGLLYGKHLWRNKGGKKVVVTEGEIDCLSVAEAFDGKYPVVSLSAGASSAKKCMIANLEWLESFDQIIIWFDSDEAGYKALDSIKGLFSPSKMFYITDDTYKDANDLLVAEGKQAVISKIYEAKEFVEESVLRGEDIDFQDLFEDIKQGRKLPYPKLQAKTLGTRDAELWLWTAGSGIGKTTIVTEVAKYQIDNDPSVIVAGIFLEESTKKSIDRFIALDNDVALKDLRLDHSLVSEENMYKTYEKYFKSNRLNFYKHFGSLSPEVLLAKMRYLIKALGCNTIILDHISIVVSGTQSDEGERKQIDIFMTELRMLVEETGVAVHAIVHLKRADKKSFNEGGKVSLSDLRGSGSLEQLSDSVIAVERDQQSATPTVARLRILKCRETGETGEADLINYVKETGRYELHQEEDSFDDNDAF